MAELRQKGLVPLLVRLLQFYERHPREEDEVDLVVEEEEDFNKVVWEEAALLKEDLIRDLVAEGLLNTGHQVNMEDSRVYLLMVKYTGCCCHHMSTRTFMWYYFQHSNTCG